MKKKTDFVAILVYLAMVVLVAIVVLPPVLRLILSSQETVEPIQTAKIAALICNRQDIDSNISYRASATYENDRLTRLIIVYKRDTTMATEEDQNPLESIPEITSFQKIVGVNMTQQEDEIKVDISENVFANSKDDTFLAKYDQAIEQEKTMFQNEGYNCQITTNE